MDTKICKICGIEKPVTEFYKNNRIYIQSYCKKCTNAKKAEKQKEILPAEKRRKPKRKIKIRPKGTKLLNPKCKNW